jgi:hypothetical protein
VRVKEVLGNGGAGAFCYEILIFVCRPRRRAVEEAQEQVSAGANDGMAVPGASSAPPAGRGAGQSLDQMARLPVNGSVRLSGQESGRSVRRKGVCLPSGDGRTRQPG